jgi:membrane protein YqaA with SNARE-associated domain
MSVKTKLARQAVKTTAKHTAHGTASKFTRKPLRSVTLLALGAGVGALVGWLIGRSAGGSDQPDPIAQAPTSPNAAANTASTEKVAETGAVS